MTTEQEKVEYKKYSLNKKEMIRYGLEGAAIDACVSYLFYRSYIAFLIFLPFIVIYLQVKSSELRTRRLMNLQLQFKEGIQSLLAALEAGYSLENAFSEALQDLQIQYEQENDIIHEFQVIVRGIQINRTVEDMLMDFADRSGLDDIQSFADIFIIAKRKGGNLLFIVRSTVEVIREKLEVQQEIQTIIAGKKLEQKIMNAMPFAIIFYVDITSAGFLKPLYGNNAGALIMTICLVIYLTAFLLSRKIIEVEV